MGNVQTTISRAATVVDNVTKTSCGPQRQAVNQNMGVNLDLTNTRCSNLSFVNKAVTVSDCNLGAISEALAKETTGMTSEQVAGLGLGLNVNSSIQDRTAKISNYLEQSCGNETAINQTLNIRVRGENLDCNQLQGLNEASATQQCIMAAVAKQVDTSKFQNASAQKTDILGGLTGLLALGPLFILGAILLGFGMIYLLFRAVFGGRGTTSEPQMMPPTYMGPVDQFGQPIMEQQQQELQEPTMIPEQQMIPEEQQQQYQIQEPQQFVDENTAPLPPLPPTTITSGQQSRRNSVALYDNYLRRAINAALAKSLRK